MEHVLSFAVRELTKIVEASFDDLLLEITKMETEQQVLEERLGKTPGRGGRGGGGGWRRGSENDSGSPSGSEDARVDPPEVSSTKEEVGAEGECLCPHHTSSGVLLKPGYPPQTRHAPPSSLCLRTGLLFWTKSSVRSGATTSETRTQEEVAGGGWREGVTSGCCPSRPPP